MLKDILIKTAQLINRDDIYNSIKQVEKIDSIENISIQNDVIKMKTFYNFVVSTIYENYLDLLFTEKITSDSEKKIHYYKLSFTPLEIISITNEDNKYIPHNLQSTYFTTPASYTTYEVTYKIKPEEVNDLCDKTMLPKELNKNIICYALASEYLASKNLYDQSEYFKNKYLYEIFKQKTKKERRLKSTF